MKHFFGKFGAKENQLVEMKEQYDGLLIRNFKLLAFDCYLHRVLQRAYYCCQHNDLSLRFVILLYLPHQVDERFLKQFERLDRAFFESGLHRCRLGRFVAVVNVCEAVDGRLLDLHLILLHLVASS